MHVIWFLVCIIYIVLCALSEWGGFPWTGYLVPVRVCLPVAVGHGTCWLAAAVGVIPRLFRLTFRPRFAKSWICFWIQTLENGLQFYSTPFCREFWCASCWHSHLIRLSTFRKKRPGRPQIYENRQKSQDTCSTNPGRVFSEGAEAPEAMNTSRTARGNYHLGGNILTICDGMF